jgi:hypothetical protein
LFNKEKGKPDGRGEKAWERKEGYRKGKKEKHAFSFRMFHE